jgi:hypothetical protein
MALYEYMAYGIRIHANFTLPELAPILPQAGTAPCDVLVTLLDNSQGYRVPNEPREYLQVSPEETVVLLKRVGLFTIRRGCEVVITPAPDADHRLIQLCTSGSIMAILLYQRRYQLVLHANVVSVGQGLVGFLGESGEGKSSMGATMLSRGHGIISDDLLPIRVDQPRPMAYPGYPQMKFSPEVADFLGYDIATLIDVHPLLGEYALRSADLDVSTLRSISALFILQTGDEVSIQRLGVQACVPELLKHSYGMPDLHGLLSPAQHLLQCSQLMRQVPIYRLQRPRSLALLPQLAQMVEETVATTAMTLTP